MKPRRDASRREFLATTVAALCASGLRVHARGDDHLKVALIGCGNRGTGALRDCLEADPAARLVAIADVFPDRVAEAKVRLATFGEGGQVADDRCFSGFDAVTKALATDADLVLLATPPHFRPAHLEAAVAGGKHVFAEPPLAVDPVGCRRVLAAADAAAAKNLSIVCGLQRRYHAGYRETLQRIKDGAIGAIVAAHCTWNQGGSWMNPRQPGWSDMEWQLRNWIYFTWLSGDQIVEQHVHNLDVVQLALGTKPLKAVGTGGRQVRTQPAFGNVYDHFAVTYEFPAGVRVFSTCRQMDNCSNDVSERLVGTKGSSDAHSTIEGETPWKFSGTVSDHFVQEHREMIAAIREGKPINEAKSAAESTLTAILGRMAAYGGKVVTWDEALAANLDLSPPKYEMGELPVAPVAIPGA